jgi:hypothetical protein
MAKCGQSCVRPSPAQAHCAGCHRTFGGVTGFDAHRRAGVCVDPVGLGYAERAGVWRVPIDGAGLERMRALRGLADATDGRTGAAGSALHPPAAESVLGRAS